MPMGAALQRKKEEASAVRPQTLKPLEDAATVTLDRAAPSPFRRRLRIAADLAGIRQPMRCLWMRASAVQREVRRAPPVAGAPQICLHRARAASERGEAPRARCQVRARRGRDRPRLLVSQPSRLDCARPSDVVASPSSRTRAWTDATQTDRLPPAPPSPQGRRVRFLLCARDESDLLGAEPPTGHGHALST